MTFPPPSDTHHHTTTAMAYPLTIPSAAPATSSYSIASDKFEEVLQTYTEEAADVLRFWFYLGKDRNWSLGETLSRGGLQTADDAKQVCEKHHHQ